MAAPGIKCFTKESVAPQLTASLQVGGDELIHGIADRWRRLCEETGSAPFQRPEWVQTYLRVFEPDNRLVLLTVYSAKELDLGFASGPQTNAVTPAFRWSNLQGRPMFIQFDLKSYERKALLVKLLWRRCGNFCSLCRDGTFLSCQYFRNTEPASNSWRLQALTVLIPSPFWRRTARRCKCSAMPMVG